MADILLRMPDAQAGIDMHILTLCEHAGLRRHTLFFEPWTDRDDSDGDTWKLTDEEVKQRRKELAAKNEKYTDVCH